MTPHLEVRRKKGLRKKWYVVIVGANSEDMFVSETYASYSNAYRSATRISVMTNMSIYVIDQP